MSVFSSLFGSSMETITSAELKNRIQNNDVLFILDVREESEHAEKNIQGATLIPLGELASRISELEPYKGREMVVYCRSGARSGRACEFLNQQGFKTKNLVGGMLQW